MSWRGVALVAALAMLAASVPATATTPAGGAVTVNDFVVSPNPAIVTAGEQVTWTWAGSAAHTFVFDAVAGAPADCPKTSGVGSTCVRTFSTAGTYPYHDALFPLVVGVVQVLPAAIPTPSSTSSTSSTTSAGPSSSSSSTSATSSSTSTSASSTTSATSSSTGVTPTSSSSSSSTAILPLPGPSLSTSSTSANPGLPIDVVPPQEASGASAPPVSAVEIVMTPSEGRGSFEFKGVNGPDDPDAYDWSFPDEKTQVLGNPVYHCFQSYGTNEVYLNVTFPDGHREELRKEVEVAGCFAKTDGTGYMPAPGAGLALAGLVAVALALRRRL